jgi:hypothetical protein
MNTELYYVVTPKLHEIDEGLFDATGNKEVELYEVVNNKPIPIKTIVGSLDENSEELIEEYIEDVAPEMYDGEKRLYNLIQL